MNRHFEEDDICRWIAGERGPEAEQHLASCEQCRAHVARMSEVLDGFLESVHEQGQRRMPAYGGFSEGVSKISNSGLGWRKLSVAALAVLLIVLAAWVPWHASKSARLAERNEDAALLRRVDAEVSRTVPGPMEPLTTLIQSQPEEER